MFVFPAGNMAAFRENLESKIIMRRYPPDTSDKDLSIMFEKYGKIEDRKLSVNRFSSDALVSW